MRDDFGFVPGRSVLHKVQPLTKAFSLLAVLTAVMFVDSPLVLFFMLAVVALLFLVSGVPVVKLAKRWRFILFFGGAIFLSYVMFVHEGQPMLKIPLPLDSIDHFIVHENGVFLGLKHSLRFLLIIFSSMLFVAVTDPLALSLDLMRLKVPYRYVYTLVLALRFVPLFKSEGDTVREAQRTRGLAVDGGGVTSIFRMAKYTFYPMLFSGLGRVESITASMESRGFGYFDSRTSIRRNHYGMRDVFTVMVISFSCFVMLFASSFL